MICQKKGGCRNKFGTTAVVDARSGGVSDQFLDCLGVAPEIIFDCIANGD